MFEFDVIVVPGGGVRPGGAVPPWTRERLDHALRIRQDEPIIVLSAGTVHRPPPLDASGFPIFESLAAARYLIKQGLDPRKVLIETCSYDTIGNAYFARVIHIEPGNYRRLRIITSDFHMPRTESIFRWVFSLGVDDQYYQMVFDSVPDTGISRDALQARNKKEKNSLQQFLIRREDIHTMNQLHQWLFECHSAYSLTRSPQKVSGKILETY
jgi:hypothetical protein